MQSAFEYAGYDVRHEWGDGEHNSRHATELFPEALTLAVARLAGADQGQRRRASRGRTSTRCSFRAKSGSSSARVIARPTGRRSARSGEMFFTDPPNNRIHKVGLDGKVSVFAENTNGANGMMFGPDGRLYAGATRNKQIVAYDAVGQGRGARRGRAVERSRGERQGRSLLHRSPRTRRSGCCPKGGTPRVVDEGIESPERRAVLARPDAALRLGLRRRSCRGCSRFSRTGRWRTSSATSTCTCRTRRRAAAPTAWRSTPTAASTSRPRSACRSSIRSGSATRSSRRRSGLAVECRSSAAPNFDEMYVTNGDKVFKRKTKVKGVDVMARAAIKPPPPRL